jgi:hypothetical protein
MHWRNPLYQKETLELYRQLALGPQLAQVLCSHCAPAANTVTGNGGIYAAVVNLNRNCRRPTERIPGHTWRVLLFVTNGLTRLITWSELTWLLDLAMKIWSNNRIVGFAFVSAFMGTAMELIVNTARQGTSCV